MNGPTLAGLFIHPVKSCRANAVTHAALDAYGLTGDRRFLVVDANDRFITQRSHPRLAHLAARIEDGTLELAAPDAGKITVVVDPASVLPREVLIWRDTVRACDLGSGVAVWLSTFLDQPVRLVWSGPGYSRSVAAATGNPDDQVAFADAHPLLVVSEASLAALNDRLDTPVPMNRFRPNVVVSGCAPHDEDRWRRIRIGDVVLRASGPCERCIVTTTDQETLERGKEPLRTLAQYRRATSGAINFGQNYIHESKSGRLEVGSPVEVLE